MSDEITVVIDGHSVAYRMFYGAPPLKVDDTPTGVLHLFLAVVDKLRKLEGVTNVIVVFDSKVKNYRHEMLAEYKATRESMPDDLVIQMGILQTIIPLIGLEQYIIDGYEADDVISTLAKDLTSKSETPNDLTSKVYIVSKDKDLHQLVDDRVFIYDYKTNTVFDRDKVHEKFELYPEDIQDMLALAGDSSDNIPGVKGVGLVTAKKLLNEYKTLDGIYDNIELVAGKLKDKLIADKEMAYLSKDLVQLKYIENFERVTNHLDAESLVPLYEKYGLKRHLEKLIKSNESVNIEIKNDYEPLVILDDFTPTVTIFYEDEIYLANANNYRLTDNLDVVTEFCYDIKSIIKKYPNFLTSKVIDILLVTYLIDADEGGLTPKKSEDKEIFFAKVVSKLDLINEKFKTDDGLSDLYYNLELEVAISLARMEINGIKVDQDIIISLEAKLKIELDILVEAIKSETGDDINLNSPRQLAVYLYDELLLKRVRKSNSTDVETLKELKYLNPVYSPLIDNILKYRELNKLISTYTLSLLEFVEEDNRIHTFFKQTGTATGRLSSVQPNMQNIPATGEYATAVRSAFISEAGYKLLSFDYSQIELRVLAHLSKDDNLQLAFREGIDIHDLTARGIYNLSSDEEVSDRARRTAKVVNFGVLYGQSAFGLSKEIDISVADATKFIDRYYDTYNLVKAYKDTVIKETEEKGYCETILKRKRYIHGINDRNFTIKSRAVRMALNAVIQGSAADIIKLAMVEIDKYIIENKLDVKPLLQIHDELIFEVKDSIVTEFELKVIDIMQNIITLDIPLIVNSYVGNNWGEI